MTTPLTFEHFAAVNAERSDQMHATVEWDTPKWMTALVGELGEAAELLELTPSALLHKAGPTFVSLTASIGKAANIAKKLVRHEQGLTAHKPEDHDIASLLAKLHTELADVLTYLFSLARHVGCDLESAVIAKFNEVSERTGMPQRLGPPGRRIDLDDLRPGINEFLRCRDGARSGDLGYAHKMDAHSHWIAESLARMMGYELDRTD